MTLLAKRAREVDLLEILGDNQLYGVDCLRQALQQRTFSEIEPEATGLRADEEDLGFALLKFVHQALPLMLRRLAVQAKVAPTLGLQ